MKPYLLALLAAVALSAPIQAIAAAVPVSASWSIPDKRANGEAMPASEIQGYEISYTIDDGKPVTLNITPGSATSRTVTLMLAGRAAPYKTTWSIVAVDTKGLKSAQSNEVVSNITVPVSNPGAPSKFTLKVECTNNQCTAVMQ